MFQELLNRWRIKCDEKTILSMWNESHRHYHSLDHLNDLINQVNESKSKFSQKEYEKLIITTLFHDIVYDPTKWNNEEKSSEFFMNCCEDKNDDILEINQMILDTKKHIPSTKLSESFCHFDMSVVDKDFSELLKWEEGIHAEFESYGEMYKPARLHFLESIIDKHPQNMENLSKLINYVKKKY